MTTSNEKSPSITNTGASMKRSGGEGIIKKTVFFMNYYRRNDNLIMTGPEASHTEFHFMYV